MKKLRAWQESDLTCSYKEIKTESTLENQLTELNPNLQNETPRYLPAPSMRLIITIILAIATLCLCCCTPKYLKPKQQTIQLWD